MQEFAKYLRLFRLLIISYMDSRHSIRRPRFWEVFLAICLADLAIAQFPPKPTGTTVLRSRFHENVTISYKEVGWRQVNYVSSS